jgi:hypothetical protein
MSDIAYFEYATVIRPQGEEVRRDRMELGTFVKIVEKGYLNVAFTRMVGSLNRSGTGPTKR